MTAPVPGQADPWRVLASLAAVLFESEEPVEERAGRAVGILERNGITFHDAFAAAQDARPAPELAAKPGLRVDWARVSEAVADRERERDEARADSTRYLEALKNVFAVLDRQALTYAERISYARTLIRTAQEGK